MASTLARESFRYFSSGGPVTQTDDIVASGAMLLEFALGTAKPTLISVSELVVGTGEGSRPSIPAIKDLLENTGLLLVALSMDHFMALRLCEIRHLLRIPTAVIVLTSSQYVDTIGATPFFQARLNLLREGSTEEYFQNLAREIVANRDVFLSPSEVYTTIDQYLEHASCFRWGHQDNMRHAPPNRYSLDQYRSSIHPAQLQRLYNEYQTAKYENRPMQLVMGDQYNFTHANAVGPHAVGTANAGDSRMQPLADELTTLLMHLRGSPADQKSATLSVLAAAAEAARAGDEAQMMAHLKSLTGGVVEGGKWKAAKEWIIDNASKIGVGVAISAVKTALGV